MRKQFLALPIAFAITVAVVLFLSRSSRNESAGGDPPSVRAEEGTSTSAETQIAGGTGEESSRSPAASDDAESARPDAGSDPAKPARLIVLVLSKKDLSPLTKVRVGVSRSDEPGGHTMTDLEGSVGDYDHRPVTGADGRVALDLDSGVAFGLYAQGDFVDSGSAHVDLSPLNPGEVRTIHVELPSGTDSNLFGKVVAADGGTPIEGARVQASDDSTDGVKTGPDGGFDLEVALWRQPHLRIEAKGFGLALVVPGAGYGSAEEPIVIRLVRSGALVARIVDRDGKSVGRGSVTLTTRGYQLSGPDRNFQSIWISLPDEEWTEAIDAEGMCRFENLPAEVPLSIEISIPEREVKRDGVTFSLSPGQLLEREWRVGAGCRLAGRAVDSEGTPVHGIPLWLVKTNPGDVRRFDRFSIETKERRTKSGPDGAFEFGDVGPGSWLIGPAPDNVKDSIAPFPDVVEIPAGSSEVFHEIRIVRGLFIRGTVVDSKGSAVPSPYVHGWSDEGWLVDDNGKDDGSFALGPLVPGKYKLQALSPPLGNETSSDWTTATAGDPDLVLRLRPGGSLSGRVVDSRTGNPCSADLVLVQRDIDAEYLSLPHSEDDGSYRCEGLPAGTYDVTARTPDGRVGRQLGIVVRPEAESTDVVIEVARGAILRIRYEAASGYGQMQVRCNDSIIAADGLAAGSTVVLAVPAGRIIAELVAPPQSREVDLAIGEEKTVVLTGPK